MTSISCLLNRRFAWLSAGTLVTGLMLLAHSAIAQDAPPQGRIVYHVSKVEAFDVGGHVEGHLLGVLQGFGVYFTANGEIANTIWTVIFDTVRGGGTAQGYQVNVFLDGSRSTIALKGTVQADEEGSRHYEGTWVCLGGTDRFEGSVGGGTYTGESMISLLDSGAVAYLELSGDCKTQ